MSTTIKNVRIFDGEGLVRASAVRVDGTTITELGGPRIATSADTVIDGRGATLLPGLIDAHVHLLPGTPRQALSFGVTTVLDMFSKPPLVGECLTAGDTQGCAQVFTSGVGATAPGGHPSLMYAPFPYVRGPHEAEDFVRDRRKEGRDT